MHVSRSLRYTLALIPALALACTSPDAGKTEEAKTEEAKAAEREVDISPEALADPTLKRDAKVRPNLEDPFKKDEGADETSEEYSSSGLAQVGTARCKGGVSERDISPGQDEPAEPDVPTEGSKKPSPDLTDPFKK